MVATPTVRPRDTVNKTRAVRLGWIVLAVLAMLAVMAAGERPAGKVILHAQPKPLPVGAITHDWPSFLGPTHNGVCSETKLLRDWPEKGPTLVWERETGEGFGAPSVVGTRLILFHRLGDTETVECLDAETGSRLWSYGYPTSYKDRYGFNGGPRSSPVIDDGRVFTHGVAGMLTCLDLKTGDVHWQRNTSTEFKVPQDFFGVGSTPLVEGDVLIVNVGAPGGPCVVGFNKRNGKIVWQAGDQWGPSYASPVPIAGDGRRRVAVLTGGDSDPPTGGLLVIDPVSGAIDLRLPFRSRNYISVNAVNPVVVGGRVFVTSSYRTGCAMVDPRGGSAGAMVWKTKTLRSHFSTPVLRDGYLYGFDEPSKSETALVCVDVKTGQRVWREQPSWDETTNANGKEETHRQFLEPGALIAADGRFICLSLMGHLLHLDLSPRGYRELRRVRLFSAKETWTPPVISRGLLYICQNARDTVNNTPPRLLCYDLRATK